MPLKKTILFIALILLIDQASKLYIKTHFVLGESVEIFRWFRILFVENEGAAWGTKISDIFPFLSDKAGKLVLTLFRLAAIVGIGYWLYDSIRKKGPRILVISIALIFAGAFGNIIDSVFYGLMFNDSYHQTATLFSNQSYGSLFHGKVVDMLYFPLIDTTWPQWVPWAGGKPFRFFEPVFNISDAAISIGVVLLIVCNKKAFPKKQDA